MKAKKLLSMLALVLAISAFGQNATMKLTFTAENSSLYVPLDSILIVNVTQDMDTMLYAPDTVLVLDYVSGIEDKTTSGENRFSVSQNYPNPFYEKTKIDLFLPNGEKIKISIRDILGREVAYYEKDLNAGHHSFVFYPSNEKCYFLTATGNQTHKTIKMMNAAAITSRGERCRLVYAGYEKMSGFKSHKATNRFGFALGDELKFTSFTGVEVAEITDASTGSQTYVFQFDGWTPCQDMSMVTDFDGNRYNTVQIGSQCWMKENLKVGTMINSHDAQANNDTIEKYCYNNSSINCNIYGGLYLWNEMMQYVTTEGAQGICPAGWHLPTDAEWTALKDFLGATAGGELKETGTAHWSPPNKGATNSSGFTALSGGYRFTDGSFYGLASLAYFWASRENASYALSYILHFDTVNMSRGFNLKADGFSVRCIKN